MNPALMTGDAKGDQVMGMIALKFGPIEDMMHIELGSIAASLVAQGAAVLVAALYEFPNRGPALAAILDATTFPVGRLVTRHAIARIIRAGALAQFLHFLGAWLAPRIQIGMLTAILGKAIPITEDAGLGAFLASIHRTAVGAGDHDSVFALPSGYFGAVSKRAFARAKVPGFGAAIGKGGFILGAWLRYLTPAPITGKSNMPAIVTELCRSPCVEPLATVSTDS